MVRSLPNSKNVVRANLGALVTQPSLFLSRRQIAADKVSTIEALAMALSFIGEPSSVVDPFYKALKYQVDRARVLKGLDPTYGDSY